MSGDSYGNMTIAGCKKVEDMPRQLRKKSHTANRFVHVAIILIAALMIFGTSFSAAPALATPPSANLADLPLTFPIQSPEVAAYFNQIARPDDIATISASSKSSISQINAGRKMIGFAAWADAEVEIENLKGQISGVLYDPEHWENTPLSEQQNLAATIKHAAEYTHARGLIFFVAPDRRFVEESLADFAPYVDMLMLQGQRVQEDPQLLAGWVHEKALIARKANPDIKIFVQVGATRGSAQVMLTALQAMSEDIDGIAVWSMPRTLGILQELVGLLRQGPPASPIIITPPEVAAASATPVIVSSPTKTLVAVSATSDSASSALPPPSPTITAQPSAIAAFVTSMPAAPSTPTVAVISPTPIIPTPTAPALPESHRGISVVIAIITIITVLLLLAVYLVRNKPRNGS
jgi:hypothetical protein